MGAPLTTTSEVIEALGGSAAVARITGRKLTAASNWHNFETFPANTYLALNAALKEIGREAPSTLWGMVEPESSAAPEVARAAAE